MPLAGILIIAVLVLWLFYLVPYLVHRRGQWATDRVLARFSPGLKVLQVQDQVFPEQTKPRNRYLLPNGEKRAYQAAQGGNLMQRRPVSAHDFQYAVQEQRRNQSAQARRALLARRRAAARRRLVLTVVLFTALIATLVVAAVTPLNPWWSLVPAALTGGVLVLGRRAVIAAQVSDRKYEQWVNSAPELSTHTAVQQEDRDEAEAEQPSQNASFVELDETQDVPAESAEAEIADDTDESADAPTGLQVRYNVDFTETWSPTPLPQPTYQLKATGPKVQAQALTSENIAASTTDAPHAQVTRSTSAQRSTPREAGQETTLDLDEITRRRRQAG